MLFILLIIGFSGCKTIEEIITGKDYGNYTSITVRISVNYKGLNSSGTRNLTLAGNVVLNEKFQIFGTATGNETCDDAILDKSHTFEVTISTTSMEVISQFINWDYTVWNNNKTNWKMLCTEWSGSIVSYTYEAGKDDPGSPVISGFDLLNGFTIDNHCTSNGGRVHDCEIAVNLTFASAYTSKDSNAADYVSASNTSSYSTD